MQAKLNLLLPQRKHLHSHVDKKIKTVHLGSEQDSIVPQVSSPVVEQATVDSDHEEDLLQPVVEDTLQPVTEPVVRPVVEAVAEPVEQTLKRAPTVETTEHLPTLKRTFDETETIKAPNPVQTIQLERVPAYKRFAHLVKPKAAPKYPPELEKLVKIFASLETVLDFYRTRHEAMILHRIQKAVQDQAGVNFFQSHFQQIMTLYPEAYQLSPIKTIHDGRRIWSVEIKRTDPEQLSVSDNLKEFAQKSRIVTFYERLDLYCSRYQDQFLEERHLDKPLIGWHPLFDLTSIPAVECAPFPVPQKQSHLEHMKKKAGIVQAILSKPEPIPQPVVPQTDASGKPLTKAQQMLERIKAKERMRQLERERNPTPDISVIKRRSRLKRLPQIASSVCLLSVAQKKTNFPLPVVHKHLESSLETLDRTAIYEHLNELCDVCPSFAQITRNGEPHRPKGDEIYCVFKLLDKNSQKVIQSVEQELKNL